MGDRNVKRFIDLVRAASGKWASWDPPIPVVIGDYGTLNENGELDVYDNIYEDAEIVQCLKDKGVVLHLKDNQPVFGEPEDDLIISSPGVKRGQLSVDQSITVPHLATASINGTWKFRDGKRGALVILHSPRQTFIPKPVLAKLLKVDLLKDKYVVTSALACAAYLMYLSDKSGESLSVSFSARAAGGAVNSSVGVGWWTDIQNAFVRKGFSTDHRRCFIPLFSLRKVVLRSYPEPANLVSFFRSRLDKPPEYHGITMGERSKMGERNVRKFIDLVRVASGMWADWDLPIPVAFGDYGTLNENGELDVLGNIYKDAEILQCFKDKGVDLHLEENKPMFGEPEDDLIISSSGVERGQLSVDPKVIIPQIATASINGTWKFQDGKRGALVILHSPRETFIPKPVLAKLLKVDLLKDKHLVTSGLACAAYLMYLSDKSGESFSVSFSAKAAGDAASSSAGVGWWTDIQNALVRKYFHADNKRCFIPLFSLRKVVTLSLLDWGGEGETWRDVYPPWKPLDEDGEEIDD